MQVVEEFITKSRSSSGSGCRTEPLVKKVKGRIIHTPEQKNEINSLLAENKEMYRRARNRGHATSEEKIRYREIRFELIRLKAI